jgi:hypothetical protein
MALKGFNVGKVERHVGSTPPPGSCHRVADVVELTIGNYAAVRIPLIACLAWFCLPLNVTARGAMAVASSS